MSAGPSASRTALLAGASGLVGREILDLLLADPGVAHVHALARRPVPRAHLKLTQHVVDFRSLPALPGVDEAYLALGTTIKVAGSQAAFRAVDFDANLAVAQAARKGGARRLGLVSAMGANARSSVFYNRVKGELEDALATLGFRALVIARPSFLVGDREALGQPLRTGEKLALRVSRALGPLVPANLRAIAARDVAAALVRQVPLAEGRWILSSGQMQQAAAGLH
ncbi:MAG: Oxidoreductase [uncultured Ramlibacter sp.]|uniref:Oxidoreductase n=1 Tax=uncultured Ramlibacter sp. TaxID=260755 RepID=A0A6J4NFY4_9BURK|nr:MAG: Oxidoreductase [uncultured Ramlibacter sp.]